MYKDQVIITANLIDVCISERKSSQCMVWHGETELRARLAIRNRHGLSFVIVLNRAHLPPTSDPWEIESGGDSLLQLGHSLHVQPERHVVQLVQGSPDLRLPTYAELHGQPTEAVLREELTHWGLTGPAFLFGAQEKAVVFSSDFGNADFFYYLLCNEDVKDSQGAIMHSAQAPLKDLEIMQFLYELGYWRAVVLHSDPLHVNLLRVIFKNQQVNVHCASKISKRPSSWPAEQPVGGRHRPFHVPAESQVVQEVDHFIDFNIGDQEFAQLFASHQHVLCDDPAGLDLPEECKSALAGLTPL